VSERDLDCDEFVELVTAYLEGALDPADEHRVLDHLELCDGCSTYLEQVRQTVRAVADLPPQDGRSDGLPDAGRERLLEAFRRGL
jgi:predicted anti-sigma-YlaC factor YlaD